MEKIKTEEVRRRRGRPKLDAHITEEYAPSRRQALNKMYMYEGVHLLSVAATEIPNSEILWQEDRTAVTVKSRDVVVKHFCNTLFEKSSVGSCFKWSSSVIIRMGTGMIVPYKYISA